MIHARSFKRDPGLQLGFRDRSEAADAIGLSRSLCPKATLERPLIYDKIFAG